MSWPTHKLKRAPRSDSNVSEFPYNCRYNQLTKCPALYSSICTTRRCGGDDTKNKNLIKKGELASLSPPLPHKHTHTHAHRRSFARCRDEASVREEEPCSGQLDCQPDTENSRREVHSEEEQEDGGGENKILERKKERKNTWDCGVL